MPTSSGWSVCASPSGPSVGRNTPHGHWSGVEKVHVRSAASGLPATSVTPPLPPLTLTVYAWPSASGADGVSVAVFVPDEYDAVALTVAPTSLVSVNVELVKLAALIG